MRRIWLACLVSMLLASPVAAQVQSVGGQPAEIDAANECTSLFVAGMGRGVWDVRGTFTGTITFYVSVSSTNVAIDVAPPDDPGSSVNSTTAAGAWVGDVAGWRTMTACAGDSWSGTAVVTLAAAATGGGGGGGGSATIGGDIELEVGAQPADDPHFVQCSNGTSADACKVEVEGGSLTVDGTVTVQDGGNSITVDNAGTFAVQASQSGAWDITNISGTVSLPTGAATAANQTTANGTLTSIATNTSNTAVIAATIEEHAQATADNTASILQALQEDESLIVCDRSASVVSKSTTGATEVIPASGTSSDKVYICSYTVQAEGTTTWQFQQGTGTNCASDTAALPGAAAWSFSTTTGMLGLNRGGGIGSILDSDAGQAVCVTQGSAVQTNFEIRYTYLTPAG